MVLAVICTLGFCVCVCGFGIYEVVCTLRNPYPLFDNSDKRLSELLRDKNKKYKTHSILKDNGYDL